MLVCPKHWAYVVSMQMSQSNRSRLCLTDLEHCGQMGALVHDCWDREVGFLWLSGPGFTEMSPALNYSWNDAVLFW